MRLGTAIELLIEHYRTATKTDWVEDKVAWALYQTWKDADRTRNNAEPEKVAEQTEPQTMVYPQVDGITPSVIEPQTGRHLPDYSYEADLGRRIMEQT